MINKYASADKSKLKEYMATKIKHKETKSGQPFTLFQICDSKKIGDDKWSNEYYSVFVWSCLNIEEKDKITFNDILALEVKEEIVDNKTILKRTIFAEVTVCNKNQPTDAPILTQDELPFA